MALHMHRGYDPSGQQYVYWLSASAWDIAGADYVGPPAFGTLLYITVVKSFPGTAEILMLMPLENTSPNLLNQFEEI